MEAFVLCRSTLARSLSLLAACAVTPSLAAHEVTWYIGDLGSLPSEQCWNYVAQNDPTDEVMQGNAVQLGPTTLSGRAYWSRSLTPYLAADGASISVLATVVNSSYLSSGSLRRSGFSIMMSDDAGRWARLGVSNSRIVLQTSPNSWGDKVIGFPVGDVAHDYRMEFFAGVVTVRVDGEAVLTDSMGYYSDKPNTVEIGDTTMWAHSETLTSIVMIETAPMCGGADLNCDGAIDSADLSMLLAAWGSSTCATDLDGDGVTGSGDIAMLLSQWYPH
jgi:hypothetical protein